jgi:hypothetical protein
MFRLPSSATFDSWEGPAAEKASQSPSPSTHTQVDPINAKPISIKTFYFALLKIPNSFQSNFLFCPSKNTKLIFIKPFYFALLKNQTRIKQPFLFCSSKNTKPESIKLL